MNATYCQSEDDFNSHMQAERAELETHGDEKSNVVGLGVMSGELQLNIDLPTTTNSDTTPWDPEVWVHDVAIRRTDVSDDSDSSSNVTYHVILTGFELNPDGTKTPTHMFHTFKHAQTALSWVEEHVPNFDLFPIELYNGTDSRDEYEQLNKERVENSFWNMTPREVCEL